LGQRPEPAEATLSTAPAFAKTGAVKAGGGGILDAFFELVGLLLGQSTVNNSLVDGGQVSGLQSGLQVFRGNALLFGQLLDRFAFGSGGLQVFNGQAEGLGQNGLLIDQVVERSTEAT
jgi:hypothetical protein